MVDCTAAGLSTSRTCRRLCGLGFGLVAATPLRNGAKAWRTACSTWAASKRPQT